MLRIFKLMITSMTVVHHSLPGNMNASLPVDIFSDFEPRKPGRTRKPAEHNIQDLDHTYVASDIGISQTTSTSTLQFPLKVL